MLYILLSYLEIFSIIVWVVMLIYFVSYEIINFIVPNITHKPHPRKGIAIACSFAVMFIHLFIGFTLLVLFDSLTDLFVKLYITIALNFNFDTVVWSYFAIPTVSAINCLVQYIFFKVGLDDINKIRKERQNER